MDDKTPVAQTSTDKPPYATSAITDHEVDGVIQTCDRQFMTELLQKHTKEICDRIDKTNTRVTDLEAAAEDSSNRINEIMAKTQAYGR